LEKKNGLLTKIPAILASTPSIFIYLFLFFYLVIFALLCLVIPSMNSLAPSSDVQLIMGNYTNVLSALGASLAAGTGAVTHNSMRKLHQKHDVLHETIRELHQKIDKMEKEKSGAIKNINESVNNKKVV